VLIISDFDIRVVPRFSNSFSSFGRNQIEVIYIQPLTAFAFQMISNAKIRFFLRIIANSYQLNALVDLTEARTCSNAILHSLHAMFNQNIFSYFYLVKFG
jgi:hypothetical protein